MAEKVIKRFSRKGNNLTLKTFGSRYQVTTSNPKDRDILYTKKEAIEEFNKRKNEMRSH